MPTLLPTRAPASSEPTPAPTGSPIEVYVNDGTGGEGSGSSAPTTGPSAAPTDCDESDPGDGSRGLSVVLFQGSEMPCSVLSSSNQERCAILNVRLGCAATCAGLGYGCDWIAATGAPVTPAPTLMPTLLPTRAPASSEPTPAPTLAQPSSMPTTLIPTMSPTTGPATSVPTSAPTVSPSGTDAVMSLSATFHGELPTLTSRDRLEFRDELIALLEESISSNITLSSSVTVILASLSAGSIDARVYFNADSELSVDDVENLVGALYPGTSEITVHHRIYILSRVEELSFQVAPSATPSLPPTLGPTQTPTTAPSSSHPTTTPSSHPTAAPTTLPLTTPPTSGPTGRPTPQPTDNPTAARNIPAPSAPSTDTDNADASSTRAEEDAGASVLFGLDLMAGIAVAVSIVVFVVLVVFLVKRKRRLRRRGSFRSPGAPVTPRSSVTSLSMTMFDNISSVEPVEISRLTQTSFGGTVPLTASPFTRTGSTAMAATMSLMLPSADFDQIVGRNEIDEGEYLDGVVGIPGQAGWDTDGDEPDRNEYHNAEDPDSDLE